MDLFNEKLKLLLFLAQVLCTIFMIFDFFILFLKRIFCLLHQLHEKGALT